MVIAVNTRLLLKGKLEGIGWFTYETFKRITVNHPEHRFIFIFDRPYSMDFIFSDNVIPVVLSPPTRHPLLWLVWFEIQIPKVLKRFGADLFLSPDGYLSLNTEIPQLAVIHDINFVHRPADLPWLKSRYYNFFFPRFAQKARRIATVSLYSKKDIINSFGIDSNKIDVVYDGINPGFDSLPQDQQIAIRKKLTGGGEYFLFVGALHPRKNICGLLRAFDAYKSKRADDVKLVIVGGRMHKTGAVFMEYEKMRFKEDVIFTGSVSESDLQEIYGAALALTFVSYFEGFGIPVVEAMNAGIPVICSDVTSLPEVGGDAALYVNPADTGEITEAMLKISGDPELRDSLIERGFINIEKFSWEKTSELLWASIEKTVENERKAETAAIL
jgi:glycosyltransferase involved in cell wall biosynthesis